GLDEREELKDTDITVQAEFLRHSLIEWRKEHPEEMLLIAIDDDIGKEQDSQIAPLWKIANAIKTMTDDDGNPLFTDKKPLKITRRSGSRGELMQEINDLLKSETKLSKNNIFLVGQWINIDKHKFDELKGSAWITGINDSQAGRELYLPVFEALTLTIMSSFNMDIESIKSFYDKIADNSVSEQLLRQMIENKVIYLLPRMDRKSKNIRKTYEIVRNIYQSV
ncbi:MAG: hypothetical protein KJ864_07205, partial [Candidatus Omnitrophica bacterium]|nr:hypothetical protein [Candidatus Omnitrophota bacterium]